MEAPTIRVDIPAPVMSTSMRDITIGDAVKRFHARVNEYKEAGFSDDEIARSEAKTQYHIPDHQRFYVWTLLMQRLLIDSVFQNFPMPDFLVSEMRDSLCLSTEDGQQRLTTLWRFAHNLFAYVTPTGIHVYYNKVPAAAPPKSVSLEDTNTDAFRRFNEYRLHFTEYRFNDSIDEPDRQNIIAEGFERRNSGKPLTDGDKLWNRKNTSVVACAIAIGMDEDIQYRLKDAFNIDIRKITSPKGKGASKSPLCTLVGLVLGFHTETGSNEEWADVMTTSFNKISTLLDPETIYPHKTPHWATISEGVIAICDAIISGSAVECEGKPTLRAKDNASFNRHLGVMVYDWRIRQEEEGWVVPCDASREYHRFWSKVIGHFASQECTMDDLDHPITQLYVDGDRKNKNTDIGKNIAQRHSQLMKVVDTWGIDFDN